MHERAQIEADLAQRRLMLVDPSNRLVTDTLEKEWNDELRALADAREERERARQRDQIALDDAIRERLVAMTTDFRTPWNDPTTPNRDRKRLLAYIIEDATLVKIPAARVPKIRVRFKGGKTETLTAPGASARPGREADRLTAKRGAYLMHAYGLSSRYDRLRKRGMLNTKEMAEYLGIH